MTIREALAEGTAALAASSSASPSAYADTSRIDSPGLDASLLLAAILNISRSSLIAAASQPLTEVSLAAFHGLIKRRLAGECIAYILGRKEFYGLEFRVNPSVLVPRPDTEILVEASLGEIEKLAKTNQLMRVLDLCTGCGAVAIALKHTMAELEVWATDISAEALEIAQANAVRLLLSDSIHFCHGDLFAALSSPFSIIVSNPPYVPTAEIARLAPEVRKEPVLALDGGDDGLSIIDRIISGAPDFLCSGGILLLEADPRQMERIAALLQQAGFADIRTYRDLSGKERVIRAQYVPEYS